MPMVGLSEWWIVGWGIGFGGAVIAALLLVAIILLGRRIASEAEEIEQAILAGEANTEALFDLARANLALDRIRRGLEASRGGR